MKIGCIGQTHIFFVVLAAFGVKWAAWVCALPVGRELLLLVKYLRGLGGQAGPYCLPSCKVAMINFAFFHPTKESLTSLLFW